MDATDFLVADAQIGGEDDTLVGERCALCGARASVDAALVREDVELVTIVVRFTRTKFGAAVESAKALITFAGGRVERGDGHSREEAICNALESAGVSL